MNGEDFKRLEQTIVNFKDEVKAEFRHQIGIQSEHFQHKLDIVIEGHEVLRKEIRDTREELCEKIKFVDFKPVSSNKEKIKRDIGWTPEVPLRRSLEDVINFWNQ